jgi:hypothetical protein
MPYTGTAWSTIGRDVDSSLNPAHTIAAMPEGKVLVGSDMGAPYASSISLNMDTETPSFAVQLSSGPLAGAGKHVAFDTTFDDTSIYFIGVEGANGSVFRNNPTAQLRWPDTDLLNPSNGAVGCFDYPDEGITGIVLAFTGEALYASGGDELDGVYRTIDDGTGKYGPLSSMPKPGIAWDQLTEGLDFYDDGVVFTAQPSALKACGCCTIETDTTLYAIDYRPYITPTYAEPLSTVGKIWAFTDCLAKRGPSLVTDDKALIGCDPVSGRAKEINLCWEQLCVASEYDVEIAKVEDFSIRVIDLVSEDTCGGWDVADVTTPCMYVPAGGTLALNDSTLAITLSGVMECGHPYWWRVKARECATGQAIRSPWSEVRSFTIKAGLPVVASFSGLQPLSPANGMIGLPVKGASFSWAPLGEDTKYKFILAKDGNMTQIVKEAEVTGTAYAYDGTLDYGTPYFWKVQCIDPACDSSPVFSFQTEQAPPPPDEETKAPPTPVWVWVVIAIGALLVIVTLVLIFKTRRV